ncbi:transcriptional regulator GcvA [Vannielia litorea]|uniref:Transcriptional regulator, LysR family n=1 Tax=Vannielia litorea TaxID=1217970 RepID=A0A1N6DUQ8_9RHOB|nr:transcriptional regulator GcvA [Vannielia litorea]SIN74480.1 transcriptional regulator, LysR family [Vannielia litorea]
MPAALPPLTALRAFEAAARHLSFARAAEELHVTPQALSLQIKSLEEHLGAPVFRRLNRAVELTEAGRALVPGAREGFSALTRGWAAARRATDPARLTVTAGPAFTAKWLAPRLPDFARAHPDIELNFSASLRRMDFETDGIDLAIRFSDRDDPGLFNTCLCDEWAAPMMSPALAAAHPTPESLVTAPLVHTDNYPFGPDTLDWPRYFRAAGLTPPAPGGPRFSHADHATDAAVSGTGVVLGRWSIAQGDLASGALVAPYPLAIRLPHRYRLLCRSGEETRPQIAAFLAWILARIADTPDPGLSLTFLDFAELP